MFQKGLQTIAWKAEDADTRSAVVHAAVPSRRRDGLARRCAPDLSDTIFVWDTTPSPTAATCCASAPLTAPANAADRALIGERESDPIDVDNTPPTITTEVTRQGGASRLVVRVRDASSPILKLEYSTGRRRRGRLVYPADGLADSPEERYEIPLAGRRGRRADHVAGDGCVAERHVLRHAAGRLRASLRTRG